MTPPELIERAIALARALQERATQLQTPAESRQQAELERMLQNPRDKTTLMQMTDEAFRSNSPRRTVDQFTHILDVQGVPRFFSPLDRALLRGFQSFGGWLPGVAVPLVKERMRHETANVILPGEHALLTTHLRERTNAGLRMNVNFLGEALLGEQEAQRRLAAYRDALRLAEVEVLSVKISTVYSQISALARDHTVQILVERLGPLIQDAARLRFTGADGQSVAKFIYLDMEEYRDMSLTAAAFMRTLEQPALQHASAGIALQAYIPDSARTHRTLNEWARHRTATGGAPITIRLVKGANMEMERVEASLRGWPQAPFKSKRETDANYKRMLAEAFQPQNLAAVRVGVASHNLFDVAFGLILAAERSAGDRVQFEMLEGMANHQRRALFEQTRELLLYAPACRKEEFVHAIGYLIRRLDENTGPDNFLRHAFHLRVGSPEWEKLEDDFRASFEVEISDAPRRTQNRFTDCRAADEDAEIRSARVPDPRGGKSMRAQRRDRPTEFQNEPDTDFSLPDNSHWAAELVARRDVSPNPIQMRDEKEVEAAVVRARNDASRWREKSAEERSTILGRVADEIRQARASLIRVAIDDARKTVAESDPEVSEAVDFVEFYRRTACFFDELRGIKVRGKGVVVVVSPWNFPIAIPCGGVAAALAAGNTVILKPSSDAAIVARELCKCFWRGGVSRETLQFFPCAGGGAGRALVTHPDVDAVILTGGTDTALSMLRDRPGMVLFAETGGKNVTIVTALADREQAIKHVIHSAFSHSGQKCSATSLLLLEAEIYDDPDFKRMLCDAVESLPVGSAAELQTRVGPLIRAPAGVLERGLTLLESGESWAVQPKPVGDDGRLWSPGVKWDVQPGSFTHCTELFGPVLGVVRFTSLDEAIALVNATGYGLTSGLETLDDREQEVWKAGVRAGNLYINRPTTGAVVLRQPFGGMGKSCIGPGMKAGGPNYVAQFMTFEETDAIANAPQNSDQTEFAATLPTDFPELPRLRAAIASYERWWRDEFGRTHDHFRLLGEDNLRRYLTFREVRVRVDPRDSHFEVFARVCAARVTGSRVVVSTDRGETVPLVRLLEQVTQSWAGGIEFIEESDAELEAPLCDEHDERIRFASPARVPAEFRRVAARSGIYLADAPVLAEGRVELLWYLREQSVTHAYHRYGNLGARSGEARAEPS